MIAMLLLYALATSPAADRAPLRPAVEAEELVYEYTPAENGAGPLWCYGSTCIVRRGENVFVSGLETLAGAKPLNNCRWMLFRRGEKGWELQQADRDGRQREPCPLGLFADGRLFLSTNPTLTPPDTYGGPANRHLGSATRGFGCNSQGRRTSDTSRATAVVTRSSVSAVQR
jgi:hypothetical protein